MKFNVKRIVALLLAAVTVLSLAACSAGNKEDEVEIENNNVVNGIRRVSQALKDGSIKICSNCSAARREFSLYKWDSARREDVPVKQNDHAMDDIRYFVTTIIDGGSNAIVFAAER